MRSDLTIRTKRGFGQVGFRTSITSNRFESIQIEAAKRTTKRARSLEDVFGVEGEKLKLGMYIGGVNLLFAGTSECANTSC